MHKVACPLLVDHRLRLAARGAAVEPGHGPGCRLPRCSEQPDDRLWRAGQRATLRHAKLTISITGGTNGSTTSSLRITTPNLPAATVGSAYNFVLGAQGGTPPYTWSLVSGTLPQGLLLDPSSGTMTGTPSLVSDAALKLQVRDAAQAVASQSFSFSVLSATSASPSGNSYYVDSSGGNDSNDGTSASSPWRTIAKVNATSFSPGDHILFKRGVTWRKLLAISSSGDSGNPIVIDAYGSGAAPSITGTDLVPQSAWSLCSSCPKNIWKASVSAQPKLVTFDGTSGDAQTSISALSASGIGPRMCCTFYAVINPGSAYMSPGVEVGNRKLRTLPCNPRHPTSAPAALLLCPCPPYLLPAQLGLPGLTPPLSLLRGTSARSSAR